MGQMDASIRPGGVFMVQLLMKEKCETPSLERMAQVRERHSGRVEAAEPSGQTADAMAQPLRPVLDVHMNEFAAGNRQGSRRAACDKTAEG